MGYERLLQILIVWELAASIILYLVGHLAGNDYIRGVGIGLIIAWVTSALAYLIVKRAKEALSQPTPKGRVSKGAS